MAQDPNSVNLFDEAPVEDSGKEQFQQPQLETDPSLQQPQVDPGRALFDGLEEDYDAEEDIYGTGNVQAVHNMLYGNLQKTDQPSPQPVDDQNFNPVEDLTNTLPEGVSDFLGRNNPGSPAGQFETAKGIVGGAAEGLFISPANLIDYAWSEAALGIGTSLTGKSRDQLIQENPAIYKQVQRELPDWLKTDTLHGNLTNGLSQFAAGFTGIGALGKLGAVKNIASGLSKAASGASWVQKLNQVGAAFGEGYPTITKTVQFGLQALKVDLKARATDFLSFDAQEGNLTNLITDLAGNRLGLVSDISKYMAVDAEDSELEGRLKNSIVGQFLELPGAAVLSSLKLLKSLNKANAYFKNLTGEIKAGSKEAKHALELLTELDGKVKDFDATWDEISQQDPQQIMDMLFAGKSMDDLAKEVESPGAIKVAASVDEDGNVKVTQEESGSKPSEDSSIASKKGVEEDSVEILDPDAPLDEAVEKTIQAEQKALTPEQKAAKAQALRGAIQQMSKQRQAAFDAKAFAESIAEKLKAGEPVSIADEFAEAMPEQTLTNVDAFTVEWKKVLKATTEKIKRRETNAEQVQRAVERIFRLNLKLGQAGDQIQEDLYKQIVEEGVESITATNKAIETLNMLEIQARAVAQQRLEADQLYWEALKTGDEALKGEALALVRDQDIKERVIDTLIEQQRSEAGRLLQSAQTDPNLQDEAWKAVQKRFEEAKQNLPIALRDADELTEAEAALRAQVTQEILSTHNPGAIGAKGHVAKYAKMFFQAATGRAIIGAGVGGGIGAASTPNSPIQGAMTGAGLGALTGFASTTKGGKYTLGVARELFYNNVLNNFETFKAIPFSTAGMKGYESTSNLIGAAVALDGERFLQAKDEIEGFIRYFGEGFAASLSVLGTGAKTAIDYTPESLRLLSAEGLRQTFGKSIGDYFAQTIFKKSANFADRLIDTFGWVYNIPTKNVLGALDTPFMVANQRAIVYRELKALGRSQGMDDAGARQFANYHTGRVVQDIIFARNHNFKTTTGTSPFNTVFNLQQLKNLNELMMGSTDQIRLAHPLTKAKSPHALPTKNGYYATNSDRAIFRTLSNLDNIAREFGIVGTWDFGFIKTFANVMQTGVDNTPVLSLLSPHNQKVALGQMGESARQNLIGKQVLGFGLSLLGFGLAANGTIAPISGSKGAKSMEKQLTGESTYTVNFPIGEQKGLTLDFTKGSPFIDTVMIPARFWQFGHEAREGGLDPGSAVFGSITATGEAFGSTRFLRGFSVKMDALLDPTYSTADNFYRNVLVGGTYSILPLGGRGWDNITRLTDPNHRDLEITGNFGNDILNYWQAKTWWGSHESHPSYDWVGVERPRDDYIGTTQSFAQNATRALTPVGIKYVADNKLVHEFERFGEQGKAITPPHKNMTLTIPGEQISLPLPLDQFKNANGETLWDAYNKELSGIRRNGLSPMDWLNEFVSSETYTDKLTDNTVTKVTGKRGTILGTRWTELAERYQSLKDEARDKLFGKKEYKTDYRNAVGQSINDIVNAIREEKSKQEQTKVFLPQATREK